MPFPCHRPTGIVDHSLLFLDESILHGTAPPTPENNSTNQSMATATAIWQKLQEETTRLLRCHDGGRPRTYWSTRNGWNGTVHGNCQYPRLDLNNLQLTHYILQATPTRVSPST
jgi:hypothetical protein